MPRMEKITNRQKSLTSSEMAENTRLKVLHQDAMKASWELENLKRAQMEKLLHDRIEGIHSSLSMKIDENQAATDDKFERLSDMFATIMLSMDKGKPSVLGEPPSPRGNEFGNRTPKVVSDFSHGSFNTQIISFIPEIDFPRFDGTHARIWVFKCNSYFKLVPHLPDEQKIALAIMNFEGKAALWYQSFYPSGIQLTWRQFLDVISSRFESIREVQVVMEFNKLKHTGDYSEYVDRFEELKGCLLLFNKSYTETYFVGSFLSGLSEELGAAVAMFNPQTLARAIELGKNQIIYQEALVKKLRGTFRSQNLSNPSKVPIKMLTGSQMAERWQLDLCYNCDEKWVNGHRCKNRIAYMLMTEEEEEEFFTTQEITKEMEEYQLPINSTSTVRFKGTYEGHTLLILLNTRSSLSFIKESTAKLLGCELEEVAPFLIKAETGHKLISSKRAKDFQWKIQEHTLRYPLRLLQHEGCDIILGSDWFRACSPIEVDYEKRTVGFGTGAKKVKLQAILPQHGCHTMTF